MMRTRLGLMLMSLPRDLSKEMRAAAQMNGRTECKACRRR
ncbi:MAG: hypothetical protein ACI9LU_000038 [Polaribacter sp.]|jgi:hypothetical protein